MPLRDIRPALRAFLLADATVSAATGGSRIYEGKMPQGVTLPSAVFNAISGDGDHHMQGPSGLATVRMQVTAWARDNDLAHALYLAIKDRLDGYRGTMGSGPAAVTVQGVFIDTWRDIEDTEADLRGKSADYFVSYDERG